MSASNSLSGSAQSATVSTRAAEWIAGVLRESGMPAAGSLLLALEDTNDSQLDLKLLNVKQLKRISNELTLRTVAFRTNDVHETQSENLVFYPPKSTARKAEWITTIAAFLNGHASNGTIYNILNRTATSLASASVTKPSPARASATKKPSTHCDRKNRVAKTSPSKAISRKRTNVASAEKPSPPMAAKKAPVGKSPAKKRARMTKKSPAKSKSTSSSSTDALVAADEAMARSLHNRYIQEYVGQFTTQGNPIQGGDGYQSLGGPLATSCLENYIDTTATESCGNASNGRDPAAGLKMPANCNDSTKPKHVPVKVKKEPLSHTSSYGTHSNTNVSAAASATEECPLRPNGARESNMVANLQDMGFTDTREILTALRAVAADREEISIVSAPSYGMGGLSSCGWSAQEQVETTMMWIVTQREEAAEAQKLDEARISSERADRSMEQSRRQDMERELENADLVDLIGSAEEDDSVEIRSRHFPCSVLLRNRSVKAVLKAAASVASLGKEEAIRLLSLEKKARKWYGTVLPFSYFQYVICPRFEIWARELPRNAPCVLICQKLTHESNELQRAMFNLSEQEEGGVGSVPKVFLAAQRDASEKSKPTSTVDSNVKNDDEVLLLPLRVGQSRFSMANGGTTGNQPAEIIDIT